MRISLTALLAAIRTNDPDALDCFAYMVVVTEQRFMDMEGAIKKRRLDQFALFAEDSSIGGAS